MLPIAALIVYLAFSGALSALWLLLVWLADRYEREPLHILALAVFWGAVPAIVLSCLLELIIGAPVAALAGKDLAEALGAVIVAPIAEETLKALALLMVVFLFRKEFDGVMDGMVYGAAVGIGFSFVEDLLYFTSALLQEGAGSGAILFALRNVAFVLNHSLFTAMTGIGFGLARTFPRSLPARIFWPLAGLAAAMGIHSLHNALALLELPGLLLALLLHGAAGAVLLGIVPFLWALERRLVLRELAEEAAEGHIPAMALDALPFSGRHAQFIPPRHRRPLREALVKLAFLRRQSEEWAREAGQALEPLRQKVRSLCHAPPAPSGAPHAGNPP